MQIVKLFPTIVGVAELQRNVTDEELKIFHELEMMDNIGNKSSRNTKILDISELSDIKKFIDDSLKEYFLKIYPDRNDLDLYVTQSWSNNTSMGQYHHTHAHPNSFISGVFYVNGNENDRIYFHDDSYRALKIHTNEFNDLNSSSWWLPSYTGRLYLFPSSLSHNVATINDSNHTRISLAFNTFLKGTLGLEKELTLLQL